MRHCGFVCLLLLAFASAASAISPTLETITPGVGQRGSEFELTLGGARLADTEEILFYTPHLRAITVKATEEEVKIRCKATPECPLGEHGLRIRTRTGISELRTFQIVARPLVLEKEPNNSRPQPIDLDRAVTGIITDGDEDWFELSLKADQVIGLEVVGMRMGSAFLDPVLEIYSPSGKKLVEADDSSLFHQDPVLSFKAPVAGSYRLRVRDTSFRGGDNARYVLHVGSFPRPRVLFPCGGPAGKTTRVTMHGDARGDFVQLVSVPPLENAGDFRVFPEHEGLSAPSPMPFRVASYGNVLESEPNDQASQATRHAGTLPIAFNGIIAKKGDVDCFRFLAKKGQVWDVQVYAYRVGSPLDPTLEILTPEGRSLGFSDDNRDHDSALRFSPTVDGEYILRVTDQRNEGGSDFVYRIEITPVKPGLSVFLPLTKRSSQERQTIVIPRGNRAFAYLGVRRDDCTGPVALTLKDLPKGVTVQMPGSADEDQYLIPTLFAAAADAPLGGQLVDVVGSCKDARGPIEGRFQQVIDLVAGPADILYHAITVQRLAVAVIEEAPVEVKLHEPSLTLVRDGQLTLRVSITRKGAFSGPVDITLPILPPFVEAPPKITIPENQTEATIVLTSLPDAAVGSWSLLAQARVPLEEGIVYIASPFVPLRITEPLIQGTMEPAQGEQGSTAQLRVKLDSTKPFTGKARIKLLNLPARTSAPEMEINATAKEFTIPLSIQADGPVGVHQNLVFEIRVPVEGQEQIHYVARGGTLRIDSPGTTRRDPSGKLLSPLEKLRQEQKNKYR